MIGQRRKLQPNGDGKLLRSLRLVVWVSVTSLAACGGGPGVQSTALADSEATSDVGNGQSMTPPTPPSTTVADQQVEIPDAVAWALASTEVNDRLDAVAALSQIGDVAVIELLQQASLDTSAEVRGAVVDALAEIGTEAAVLAVTFALSDPDGDVREEAIEVLAEVGTATARDLLHQALADDDAAIRELAAEAISQIDS